MFHSALIILWVLVQVTVVSGQELFQNPDFEDEFGSDNWWCLACTLEHSTDAYTGQFSGQVTARDDYWAGISQNVPIEPNKLYFFSLRLKMMDEVPGYSYNRMTVLIEVDYVGGDKDYKWIAEIQKFRADFGWQLVAADFTMDEREIENARFYVQFEEADVNYVIDTASLTEVVRNPDWREEADERIEQLRKEDLTVLLTMSPDYEPSRMEVQVSQTRHDFPFGTAIQAAYISGGDDTSASYQDFFYKNYNWAVFEYEMKWPDMEPVQGEINFERLDDAMVHLLNSSVRVRGHCIVWNIEDFVPDWLLPMEGEEVRQEVDRRIDYVVTHFKGQLEHWDVNNEQLHGDFFEAKIGDRDILDHMFHETHSHDPDTPLFLNDYELVNTGHNTAAAVNQAGWLLSRGVPVHGIGVQSHMLWGRPDVDALLQRLDLVATAGLPIWVTELDVTEADVSERANGYEDALRVYFSHPSVDGVLMWGFWEGAHWQPDAVLVEGPDFHVNEAGERYEYLIHDEWKTRFTWQPENPQDEYQARVFQGAYELTVLYDGAPIQVQEFYVNKGASQTVNVDVV